MVWEGCYRVRTLYTFNGVETDNTAHVEVYLLNVLVAIDLLAFHLPVDVVQSTVLGHGAQTDQTDQSQAFYYTGSEWGQKSEKAHWWRQWSGIYQNKRGRYSGKNFADMFWFESLKRVTVFKTNHITVRNQTHYIFI